jgi:hypothetical protein
MRIAERLADLAEEWLISDAFFGLAVGGDRRLITAEAPTAALARRPLETPCLPTFTPPPSRAS